jgi:magnesium transporter
MVLYAVLDPLVDAYFGVIDQVSDEIDTLEEAILARRDPELLERLVRTRRWLLETRHLVVPMREILDGLAEQDLPMIDVRHRVYFRDVYGQVVHIVEELDTQREIASGVLDAYLSGINNSLAEVMRRLTAITAVLAGVGATAGIFGMSEAGSALGLPTPLGFWLITAVMVMVGVLVFAYFRRIDWI